MDAQLGKTQFMAGDEFSYGDIPVGIMIYRYMQLMPERPATPNLDRWYAAISSRAGVQGADRGGAADVSRYSASPRSSFGTSPVRPAASRMNKLLQRRQAVDQAEADVAHEPQHVGAVGEQPVEPVGRDAHRHGVEPPPALIALEHVGAAGIEAEPRRVDDRLRERRDIAQAHD